MSTDGGDKPAGDLAAEFVQQWGSIVNWADVDRRFHAARAQTPGLVRP